MTDLYSLLLAGAIAALVVSAGAALASGMSGRLESWSAAVVPSAAVALALDAAAVLVHWRSGHAAGSQAPMGAARFVAEHPAFAVVAVVALVALAAARRRRR